MGGAREEEGEEEEEKKEEKERERERERERGREWVTLRASTVAYNQPGIKCRIHYKGFE
jgi:hypothetical protein